MTSTTKTVAEAAMGIGCEVGQIVKSLVFQGAQTGKPYLIVISGAHRVDEQSLELLIGEAIQKATPNFVRETTGYAIGGVPPLGHPTPISTWMDNCLLQHEVVWAAAGTPETVFAIAPDLLRDITSAATFNV